MRVLRELALIEYEATPQGQGACRLVTGAPRTALERSAAYRAYQARLASAREYLSREAAALSGSERGRLAAPGGLVGHL